MAEMKHRFSTGKFTIKMEDIEGLCTYPEDTDPVVKEFLDSRGDSSRSISISPHLKGKRELEVLIHESLHAEYPSIPKGTEEEWVDEAANNISRLLWRLGWRKNPSSD